MIALSALLGVLLPLFPAPSPDPGIPFGPNQMPNYVVNGDGTRISCVPGGYSCWPDTSGLPSYLVGE